MKPKKTKNLPLPSAEISKQKLAHLSTEQQAALLNVLDKYPECFPHTPGCCDACEFEINVTSDFKPGKLKPYRIPEKFKAEVEKQLQELLILCMILCFSTSFAFGLCFEKTRRNNRCTRCQMCDRLQIRQQVHDCGCTRTSRYAGCVAACRSGTILNDF